MLNLEKIKKIFQNVKLEENSNPPPDYREDDSWEGEWTDEFEQCHTQEEYDLAIKRERERIEKYRSENSE